MYSSAALCSQMSYAMLPSALTASRLAPLRTADVGMSSRPASLIGRDEHEQQVSVPDREEWA